MGPVTADDIDTLLFDVLGGGRAERAEYARDTGWAPIERAKSRPDQAPTLTRPLRPHSSDVQGMALWKEDMAAMQADTKPDSQARNGHATRSTPAPVSTAAANPDETQGQRD